jgi:hypothetical protein
MASIVERLTENIVERNLLREGAALSKKWEKTGLLEGIDSDMTRTTMSRLLENQAKELLREASTMSAGDVEGFAAVAFPIVRRVFGGLIANELVAVQPMSLPSGLIFFLDFTYSNETADKTYAGAVGQQSVYGGNVVASQITGGISLNGFDSSGVQNLEKSFYSLNNGFSSVTASGATTSGLVAVASGVVGSGVGDDVDSAITFATNSPGAYALNAGNGFTTSLSGLVKYDPDLVGQNVVVCTLSGNQLPTGMSGFDAKNLTAIQFDNSVLGTVGIPAASGSLVRRLTSANIIGSNGLPVINTAANGIVFVFQAAAGVSVATLRTKATEGSAKTMTFAIKDTFQAGSTSLGSVAGGLFGLEGAGSGSAGVNGDAGANYTIPEIDIKVDTVAVTAQTKKLKAKWSPELGQDLNAYHNLDAEVELTSILSEHVALEIDQEILQDLIKGATAAVKYWSRRPGKFVNRDTGASTTSVGAPPDFTGNVSMWYETLIETINDVSAQIHRKTRRGGANFLVTSPEVANILEFTSGFRADVSMEDLKGGSVGAVKAGSLSRKWDLYVDPYFPRNLVLVGRRGKAFLESGYVYAPYVPLMITPTIFGTEDFVPRKGLMTRYAKKMVRPDMFGLVVVQDLIG